MTIPKHLSSLIIIGTFFLVLTNCSKKPVMETPNTQTRLEQILTIHSLDPFYPRVIDTINGGYYSNFAYDWAKEANQQKFIVTQARHVWTLSKALEFYPERSEYIDFAHLGYLFLKDKMWDSEYGGFFELVDSTGALPDGEYAYEKRAYGNSFAIYGLAAYYQVSKDPAVLNLAIEAFHWLDKHAHDNEFGGYFQYIKRDGTIIPRSVLSEGYNAPDKAMVGLKDYNSSIHILEAFTELYHIWPDEVLRTRLEEMYHVVSETMFDPRGFLKLHFNPDWTLVTDQEIIDIVGDRGITANHVTFGHDVETAFLLLEAAETLGIDHDKILPKAKQFVDHALEKGWDNQKGGFYEQGKYIDDKMVILDKGKNWWAQAEGLNSLLLMHTYFPDDSHRYYEKFETQLAYIETNLIDHEYTGWYSGGIDVHPEIQKSQKSQLWKGNYHTARSLMNCISMLKKTGQ